jgi:PE-PPE domain
MTSPAEKVTVFMADGTHTLFDFFDTSFEEFADSPLISQLTALMNPEFINVVDIEFPDSVFPMETSINQGVTVATNLINALPEGAPFILVGYSQGAAVTSFVLNELQTGSLTSRLPDMLAGVTFGNIVRQSGKVAPVQTDPGGNGVWGDHLLTNTPSNWWDFANLGDIATQVTTDGGDPGSTYGTALIAFFEAFLSSFDGSDLLTFLSSNILDAFSGGSFEGDIQALVDLVKMLLIELGVQTPPSIEFLTFNAHAEYISIPPPGVTDPTQTSVVLAADFINSTAASFFGS